MLKRALDQPIAEKNPTLNQVLSINPIAGLPPTSQRCMIVYS